MTLSFTGRKRVRKSFGRIPSVTSMPNLIEVQKSSYDSFLMMNDAGDQRPDAGLQAGWWAERLRERLRGDLRLPAALGVSSRLRIARLAAFAAREG